MKLSEPSKIEGCKCKIVSMKNLANTVKTADEMYEFMILNRGAGLAAPQIGIFRTFFIMKDFQGAKYQLIINPEIHKVSDKLGSYKERCLTYPKEYVTVKRPKQIRASWTNHDGIRVYRKLTGQEGQIFSHEFDHLIGLTIMNKEKTNER